MHGWDAMHGMAREDDMGRPYIDMENFKCVCTNVTHQENGKDLDSKEPLEQNVDT